MERTAKIRERKELGKVNFSKCLRELRSTPELHMCESYPNTVHRLRCGHMWTDPNSTLNAFKFELTNLKKHRPLKAG